MECADARALCPGGSDHTFNGIRIPVHIVTAVNALQVILRGCETAYSLDT